MNGNDPILRRNFILAAILHLAIIAGMVVWEWVFPERSTERLAVVELVMPADVPGDLPVGPGHGRGAFTPPPPGAGLVSQPPAGGDDGPPASTAPPAPPAPAPVAPPPMAANEIAVPSRLVPAPAPKTAPKTATKTATKTPAKTATKSSTPRTPASKATTGTRSSSTPSRTTGSRSGTASSSDIAHRFYRALGPASSGGTAYGDGSVAGGGSGRSSVIGSPNGSPDGMIGGVGAGSPHADYYMHVHDKLYQAWEQPGSVRDRGLVVIVQIRVARDGSIVSSKVLRSSGNRAMDDSALEAVRRVGLLQPPPAPLVRGSAAEISVNFEMEG